MKETLALFFRFGRKATEGTEQPKARLTPADGAVLEPGIVSQLRELERSTPGLLGQLQGLFLARTAEGVSAIEEALGNENAAGVAQQAHALKGAALNLGARDLAQVCGVMEQDANNGRLAAARAGLEPLQQEVVRARRAVDELVSSCGS
jgi:HPt (histidine-containing phosphotransfer) domain-containing protein